MNVETKKTVESLQHGDIVSFNGSGAHRYRVTRFDRDGGGHIHLVLRSGNDEIRTRYDVGEWVMVHTIVCPACGDNKAVEKTYVGSTDKYNYCPGCMHTWGGEETPAKKALLAAACEAKVTEQDELEGKV